MTHTTAHRIGRPLLAVCCSLMVALATAVAAAQDPPDQPSAPQDQPPGPAADRTEGEGPGMPMPERRFRGEWQGQGQQFRVRASQPATQRLDALEAKLDTLLNEVRQLRREINRQQAGMYPRRPEPRYGQGPNRGPYRGEFHRDGQRPPFGRPDFAAPDRSGTDSRGTDSRGTDSRHRGPQSFREFDLGPGPRSDSPQGWFGPPPRSRRGDSDARDQQPDGPRNEHVDRGPDGPRPENMDQGREGPRSDNMNRGPDRPRRGADRGFGGSDNPSLRGGPDGRRFDGPPNRGPDGPGDRGPDGREQRSGD